MRNVAGRAERQSPRKRSTSRSIVEFDKPRGIRRTRDNIRFRQCLRKLQDKRGRRIRSRRIRTAIERTGDARNFEARIADLVAHRTTPRVGTVRGRGGIREAGASNHRRRRGRRFGNVRNHLGRQRILITAARRAGISSTCACCARVFFSSFLLWFHYAPQKPPVLYEFLRWARVRLRLCRLLLSAIASFSLRACFAGCGLAFAACCVLSKGFCKGFSLVSWVDFLITR